MNFVATGIGAGLVSALLTAVIVKATPLAAVLYLLAPIPVLIASLGWDHRSGLVAGIVGGVAIALILSPLSGIGFALITPCPPGGCPISPCSGALARTAPWNGTRSGGCSPGPRPRRR